jgi:hypothetical protein
MFYEARVTDCLSQIFDEELRQAKEVTARDRIGTALPSRFAESLARVLSPLL